MPDLGSSINFNIGKLQFSPSYLQAGIIVALLFILILSLAQFRRFFVKWSLKGSMMNIFLGFVLALILEGFLIIGGRTALTELLGWKSAPKPISTALDKGRSELVNVLGVTEEIPSSMAGENMTSEEALKILQALDPTEIKKVKSLICEP